MTDTTDRPAAELEMGASRRILILISAMLSVALYFSSILVASTVLPQMQGSFSATPDEVSWTMTFNILATAIAMPMTGWLTARFGRSTVMIWSTGIFTVSTALCGFATSLEEMILWRIAQGAAGAPCVPLAQTILLDTFPPRQHRMVLGVYGMGVVLGPIIGPTIGGYLAEILNWRWAFFLLIPVGVAATLGLSATLPADRGRGPVYLSWIGFILLSVALGGLQLALSRGPRLDWLESMEIRVTLFISVVAFYLFLAHSLTSRRPFLDLRLLLDRNYSLGLALIAIFGMLNFVPMVLLPPLMRIYMGYPDVLVGQVVGARGIGGLLGFFAVIFLSRLDPRVSVGAGFVLQCDVVRAGDERYHSRSFGRHHCRCLVARDVREHPARADARGDGDVPSPAQYRREPVHIRLRCRGRTLHGHELRRALRADIAVQPHAGAAVGSGAVRHVEPELACASLGRDIAAGGHDRAPQCIRAFHCCCRGVIPAGAAVAECEEAGGLNFCLPRAAGKWC